MKVNGSAIYATRPVAPYVEEAFRFTRAKDGTINAIYVGVDSNATLPATVSLQAFQPKAGNTVVLLGVKKPLSWKPVGNGCEIAIPDEVRANLPCKYAWTFQMVP